VYTKLSTGSNSSFSLNQVPLFLAGVLLLVVATFLTPASVFAENRYYQPIPTPALDLEMADFVSNRYEIGEFTLSAPVTFDSGQIWYEVDQTVDVCGGDWFHLQVATSTAAFSAGYSTLASDLHDISDIKTLYQEPLWNGTLTSQTGLTLQPGTYHIWATIQCNFGTSHVLISADTLGQFFGVLYDQGGLSEPLVDDTTRIYYLDPSDGETVSTSTSQIFYVDYYLEQDRYEPDLYMELSFLRQQDTQAAVANQELLWKKYALNDPILDGFHSLSTTTDTSDWEEGLYFYRAAILRQSSWWETGLSWIGLGFLNQDEVVASTTTFIYGQPTSFDSFIASTSAALDLFNASTTLSLADVKAACSLSTSFSIVDCFSYLFSWQPTQMNYAIQNMKEGFFSYVPFGYLTRSFEILSNPSTSTLPTLSYTFPASAPSFLASSTFSFNPWQYFYVDGAPIKDEIVANDGSGKNIWDIFQPLIEIIVYISLILLVIKDLTGIHPNHKDHL